MTESYPSEISNKRIKRDFHLFFYRLSNETIYILITFAKVHVYTLNVTCKLGMYLDK